MPADELTIYDCRIPGPANALLKKAATAVRSPVVDEWKVLKWTAIAVLSPIVDEWKLLKGKH